MNKADIIAQFEELLKNDDFNVVREGIRAIRDDFRKVRLRIIREAAAEFTKTGGRYDEYEHPHDPLDDRFNELYDQYKARLEVWIAEKEEEKKRRAERKKQYAEERKLKMARQGELLQEMTQLVSSGDQSNEAFDKFKDIQSRWNEIGHIKHHDAQPTQSAFNHQVDVFFYNRNMVRDFIILDQQKNVMAKKEILEQMKELAKLESISDMDTGMKKLQKDWKEIGPVPYEDKDEINAQYVALADEIYGKIKGFYETKREEYGANLEKKEALIEKVKAAIEEDPGESHDLWQKQTQALIDIQAEWKTIGYSDKNEEIWQEFRGLCDDFFNRKNEFYGDLDSQRQANKEAKLRMIAEAAGLKDSSDWKNTANKLIELQRQWKATGNAQRSDENRLWRQFRKHCDVFFKRKKEHFASRDKEQLENMKLKEALIEEINAYELKGENDVPVLQEFAKRWRNIGFVPYKEKDRLYKKYNEALDVKYGELRISGNKRKEMSFQNRIENLQSNQGNRGLSREENNIRRKMDQLREDINQYENNLGFFSSGNKENPMQKMVEEKIRGLKNEMQDLRNQLKMLQEAAFAEEEAEEEVVETTEDDKVEETLAANAEEEAEKEVVETTEDDKVEETLAANAEEEAEKEVVETTEDDKVEETLAANVEEEVVGNTDNNEDEVSSENGTSESGAEEESVTETEMSNNNGLNGENGTPKEEVLTESVSTNDDDNSNEDNA